jgi:tetratricopeptide (TPR) repeat protein
MGAGNPPAAYHAARAAAALAPASWASWLHGASAARMLRLEEAAEALERLAADDPLRPSQDYFVLLGDVYHFLGRYEDELRVAREARRTGRSGQQSPPPE